MPGYWRLAVLAVVLQAACIPPGALRPEWPGLSNYTHTPGGLDSPSVTCRNSLSGCAALYGKEVASVTGVLKVALEAAEKKAIQKELEECANLARTEVLLKHAGRFEKPSPNAQECRQETKDARGRKVTWAQRLGLEMHEAALKCVGERLGRLRPGKYSLEPRYRPNLETKEKKLVSAEEEQALEESGNRGELLGTLKPDVVIHMGDPLEALAAYDFKFPCAGLSKMPEWYEYPAGHPFHPNNQGEMYERYIAKIVRRVAPWIGVELEQ